ncbi:DNRLRE domain-containing protein [Chitinophaga sp. Mgbs1]|uniref:DNRLRE domain-containing protein n=1 Tax=Chitinophaga solisilvae TaxID=1233460 RepID=A0A9Q5GSE3_9BACT|nr:DNRLRE domain-containing protein [Chitinophaga solisilvae]
MNVTKLCMLCCLIWVGSCYSVMAAFRGKADSIPTVNDSIMNNIRQLQWAGVKDTAALRSVVDGLLATMQPDGSWSDINYAGRDQTNWQPVTHLDRLRQMALAYTKTGNYYYQRGALQQRIADGLTYWYNAHPTSTNWWYQQIACPQRVGVILILMRAGAVPLPATVGSQLLSRMATEGGRPDQPGSQGSGANKLDIATHWIYRGSLTADSAVLAFGVAQAYYPIFMTTGEGLQYDLAYKQHGMQLYIGGYGSVFLSGEVNVALFTAGTTYALAGSRLDLLSRFIRETYFKTIRGKYMHFDVLGRGVSRSNALSQGGLAGLAANMKILDPANAGAYDAAISRVNETQPASYGIAAGHTHYHSADYTLHTRPAYSVDVRTVSSRTLRNENGNGENLKGYFLADGATHITTAGNEYFNIFPVWDWARIPGVTAPLVTTIPLPAAWGTYGTSTFTGGVSDSLYGVSTYAYTDNGFNINTTARKSWFFFEEEVVCLGAGISSTHAQPVNTTLDQSLLNGPVTVASGGTVQTVTGGQYTYNGTQQWILHNGTGYTFPLGGKAVLSAAVQTGSWKSINSSEAADTVSQAVFKLWLDHGVQPVNNSYAYTIVPGKDAAGMAAYNAAQVQIAVNTDSVQAVYHAGLDLWGLVFFRPATFRHDSITIQADAGCVLLLKHIGTPQVTVHAADPSQAKRQLTLRLKLPAITGEKALVCQLPVSPYAGATVRYTVDHNTPGYTPPAPVYTRSLFPVADAYVNDGSSAAVNYGAATGLVIKKDNASYNREVFLKFDVSQLDTAQIEKATLELKVKSANTSITTTTWQTKFISDNGWQEMSINWNNRPASAGILDTFPGSPAGTTAVFNITGQLKAIAGGNSGQLSLHVVSTLRGDAKTDASFHSRETADSALRPRLVIYLKAPAATNARSMAAMQPDMKMAVNKSGAPEVMPNPASHNVYIRSNRTELMILTDNRGQEQRRVQVTAGSRHQLDVSALPPGVYYLRGSISRTVQRLLIVR